MQIVIDIPEDLYCEIQAYKTIFDEHNNEIADIIKHGTPLPKGHGDLIDVHELVKGRASNDPTVILANHAEIIIGADKV